MVKLVAKSRNIFQYFISGQFVYQKFSAQFNANPWLFWLIKMEPLR